MKVNTIKKKGSGKMKHKLIETEIIDNLKENVIGYAYFERLSGWKNVKNIMVTKRHKLFECATDDNGYTCNSEKFNKNQKWYYLDYVEYKGYRIPLSSCANLFNNLWFSNVYRYKEKDGIHYINSYDMDGNLFNPLFFEFSQDGEQYRVYIKKGRDHTC